MPIKRRFAKKDKRLTDYWNSREIGNNFYPAQLALTPEGVTQARTKSYLAEMVDDECGEDCKDLYRNAHAYDPSCTSCQIRQEYKQLLRAAARGTEDTLRLPGIHRSRLP